MADGYNKEGSRNCLRDATSENCTLCFMHYFYTFKKENDKKKQTMYRLLVLTSPK